MKFQACRIDLNQQQATCLVVGVYSTGELTATAADIDKISAHHLQQTLNKSGIDWQLGSSLLVYDSPARHIKQILVLGLGENTALTPGDFLKLIAQMHKQLQSLRVSKALSCLAEIPVSEKSLAWNLSQQVLVSAEKSYRYDRTKTSDKNNRPTIKKLLISPPVLASSDDCEAIINEAKMIAGGVQYARELGDLPGNLCNPAYLARQAHQLEKTTAISSQILDHSALKKAGFGALLAVARGSHQKPQLIVMEYQGTTAQERPVVLVGKGLTFDAGGISLKPSAKMDEMKYDMCGAAAVLGTMKTIAELALPIHCIGIIPASENLPDGNAYRPGDVITSLSGKTIEILNTDAEGRLILCDALTYAREYTPAVVIDIATLTGACAIALGNHASGLFSADEELTQQLLEAGEQTHDRAWRMPLWDDYQEQLKSNFADLANVGGREGGAITAARFLASFTEELRWAHLDIAGTAWRSGNKKGSTGRPVALLCRYLINRALNPQTKDMSA